jgi:hypothetical protein
VLHLEVVIVIVGVGAEFQLLHLHHVLLLLGVVLLLLLVVLIVAEVDGLGDRRNGRRRDQHQIEAQLLGLSQSRRGGHDFGGAVRKHRAHFTRTNGFVHVLSAVLPARRKISAWIHCYASANGRSRSRAFEDRLTRAAGCEKKDASASNVSPSVHQNRRRKCKKHAAGRAT